MHKKKAKIALSMGYAKGVGPEVSVSAAAKFKDHADITIYGNRDILTRAMALKKINNTLLNIHETPESSFKALESAVTDVLSGRMDAVVTAPINKHEWKEEGVEFVGHTEYLAHVSGTKKYAMMLAGPKLKVTIATIHTALKNVSSELTEEKIVTATTLTNNALKKYFAVERPRIAICGLNPHCGEDGMMGTEERDLITPVIKMLANEGIGATGPYPADTVFTQASGGKFDAVIAMYHDQGLIPVKTLDFTRTVNITLGIPFIRTSVDHGTAEDIAWKGIADDGNMIAAIEMAIEMFNRRTL